MDVWSKSISWARLKKYRDPTGRAYEEIEKVLVYHELDCGLNHAVRKWCRSGPGARGIGCMDVWSKSISWARLKKYQDPTGQAYEALVYHELDRGLNHAVRKWCRSGRGARGIGAWTYGPNPLLGPGLRNIKT
jgi:hypothetical protein